MDNAQLDIRSEGDANLVMALKIAFFRGRTASHYSTTRPRGVPSRDHLPMGSLLNQPAPRLVFYWGAPADAHAAQKLPFAMDADGAADFTKRWLASLDYGREPDHDGSNGRGWRVYNHTWGHVDSESYAIVAIEPIWAMYGK
jgi:hypothetical protein